MHASVEPASPRVGSCCGHAIHSSLPFRILRDGHAGRPLAVRRSGTVEPEGTVVARWEPRPGNPFHGRLLRTGAGTFAFWASDAGWFGVDPSEPSITIAGGDEPLSLTAEVRLFGVPATLVAMDQGDVCLHASGVEIDGRAVLFAGPSRHGKTTLAAAFAAAGHRLLTEDMTRCTPGALVAAYPGPAVVRMRPDVAGGVRPAGAFDLVEERERVFMVLDGPQRGTGDPVPVAAILLLREEPGPARLESAATPAAIRDLWSLAFTLPSDASHAAVFERIVEVASRVPVLDLHREMTIEALPRVINLVERLARSGATR
jgi:hypothetical protein